MHSPVSEPYYFWPALQSLRDGQRGPDDAALLARIALNAGDPAAVAVYANLDGDDFSNIYPPAEAPTAPETGEAINTFMAAYGGGSDKETALLERLIFNPTPDYADVLIKAESQEPRAESAKKDDQDALIAAFISSYQQPVAPEQPRPSPAPEPTVTKPKTVPAAPSAEASSLTESLARVYIKQQRYDRAYAVIEQLNLKNPKKSVYFADQMRFLKKLMALQEARKSINQSDNQLVK